MRTKPEGVAAASIAIYLGVFGAWAEPAPTFKFEAPTTFMSTQDMEHNGFMFPDGTMWFLRQSQGDPYVIFGSGGSLAGAGAWARLPWGTYRLEGSLDAIHPPASAGRARYSLTQGQDQPSPDGADFDRDYAGGGPTYRIDLPKQHHAAIPACSGLLLQIYHGEYHYAAPRGMPAYGGSGMAVSCDGGATFSKIGQILQPFVKRDDYAASVNPNAIWADGAMIEADARGLHACSTAACDTDRFDYLLFTDHNVIGANDGLSIARIRKQDLLDAVAERRPPQFRKYFNPSGQLNFEDRFFSEPGVGGRSTPVIQTPGEIINTPGVVYDSYLNMYVAFYQVNQKQVVLRTSQNLMSWSLPQIAYRLEPKDEVRVYYPALIGSGADPQTPGQSFYLFFLIRALQARHFTAPELLRQRVVITP